MILPISDHYYGVRLCHTGKLSEHLEMPEICREEYFDCKIEARGPGRIDASGRRIGMQADAGDRILCDPAAFQHYEPGNPNTRKGFVSDRHLLGVIRGPKHAALEPAADLLLIDPDPRQDEEVLESGVVVVKGNSLPGDEQRRRQRGFELLQGYVDILGSEKYREEPTKFDKMRHEKDFVEAMCEADRAVFIEVLAEQRREHAKRGIQGVKIALDSAVYEPQAPIRLRERICSGVVRGLGPDCLAEVALNERVRWSTSHMVTRIAVGGSLRLLLPEKYVLAAMEG